MLESVLFMTEQMITFLTVISLLTVERNSILTKVYKHWATWIWSEVHWSRLTDFTLDMCTPRFLWIPAHRMQINTPRFQDAHLGPDKARKTKETNQRNQIQKMERCRRKSVNMCNLVVG